MNFNKITTALAFAALSLAPLSASAAPHTVDSAHTFVLFKVSHFGISNSYGMFKKAEGTFDPDKGTMDITIKADSIFTANKKRDDHLKSPDFFNAKQFPTITFKADKTEKKGDSYMVSGKLTMKGKTKPVTMTVKKTGEGKGPQGKFRTGFEGTMTVNRIEFGVDTYPGALSNDVEIIVSVEGIKG